MEDVRADVGGEWVGAEGFSSEFQVALPYQGLFVWEVGRDAVVGDPNQVLFVAEGEAFRMRTRFRAATPSSSSPRARRCWTRSPVPRQQRAGAPVVPPAEPDRTGPGLQLLRARLLAGAREGGRRARGGGADGVAPAEALAPDERRAVPPARCTQRLLERTKTYLASGSTARSGSIGHRPRRRGLTRVPDPAVPRRGGRPAPWLPHAAPAGAGAGRAATRRGPDGARAGARILEPQPFLGPVPSGLRPHPVRVSPGVPTATRPALPA